MSGDNSELGFASDRNMADERFNKFHTIDPFPEIPPALLNENDIYNYCRITGMVFPFESEERVLNTKLKFASYEIDFLGDVHYVDDNDVYKPPPERIEKGTPFTLRKNSIAFVYLQTEFRLPYYIAIRFNLKIRHVHRGLLLGTGPLVDPGYKGRLLVPLHNLTSKDYTLIGGEGLIWVEFTKLSPHVYWNPDARKSFKSTPIKAPSHRKIDFSAQQFFNLASEGKPAASSIPGEVRIATKSAEDAKSTAVEIQKKVEKYAMLGAVAIIISIAGLVIETRSLILSASSGISSATIAVTSFRDEQMKFQKRLDDMEAELKRLRAPAPQPQKQSSTTPQKVGRVDLQQKADSHTVSVKNPVTIPKENN